MFLLYNTYIVKSILDDGLKNKTNGVKLKTVCFGFYHISSTNHPKKVGRPPPQSFWGWLATPQGF